MNVLVTGHRGYIGSLLVPMLLARGHVVRGIDSDLYKRCTFFSELTLIPEKIKDIRHLEFEDLGSDPIDAIIHLAGLSNDPLGDFDPEITQEINYGATLRLAEMAKSKKVKRFLFASSCSNYGAADDSLLDETASFNPVTAYGRSKVNAEKDLSALASNDFSPTYLRAGTVYGLSPKLRFDLVLNNLTAWAKTTGRVLLKSDGSSWRPLVHIEDVCKAYIEIMEAPLELVHNQAFNIGSTKENYRVRELATLVSAAITGSTIEFQNKNNVDIRNYRVNCDKLARLIPAAQPTWSAMQGIGQLARQFELCSLTPDDFEGTRFQRIAHLQWLVREHLIDEHLYPIN